MTMSNPFEGPKMPELDEIDLAQMDARKKESAGAKQKMKEILAGHASRPKTLKDVFPSGVARARRDAKKLAEEDNLTD
jgi:hypothetical protein